MREAKVYVDGRLVFTTQIPDEECEVEVTFLVPEKAKAVATRRLARPIALTPAEVEKVEEPKSELQNFAEARLSNLRGKMGKSHVKRLSEKVVTYNNQGVKTEFPSPIELYDSSAEFKAWVATLRPKDWAHFVNVLGGYPKYFKGRINGTETHKQEFDL